MQGASRLGKRQPILIGVVLAWGVVLTPIALSLLACGPSNDGTLRVLDTAEAGFRRGINISHWMSEPLGGDWAARYGIHGETWSEAGRRE